MRDGGAVVLIVEDDETARNAIAGNLRARGHDVDEAGDVREALRLWDCRRPDLILLDLGLPDLDGQAVILRVRREATTPIIVVSARGREEDRVAALDAGADDYLTKPFGLSELHARMRAVLRRAAGPEADTEGRLSLGPVVMDVPRHEVSVGGTPIELTPREFELLKILLSQSGRVVTAGRLLRAVWGTAYSDEGHYLHVYVSRLRRKLAAADPSGAAARLIVAEPGVGTASSRSRAGCRLPARGCWAAASGRVDLHDVRPQRIPERACQSVAIVCGMGLLSNRPVSPNGPIGRSSANETCETTLPEASTSTNSFSPPTATRPSRAGPSFLQLRLAGVWQRRRNCSGRARRAPGKVDPRSGERDAALAGAVDRCAGPRVRVRHDHQA